MLLLQGVLESYCYIATSMCAQTIMITIVSDVGVIITIIVTSDRDSSRGQASMNVWKAILNPAKLQ